MKRNKKKWFCPVLLLLMIALLAMPAHASAASNIKLNKTKVSIFKGKGYTLKLSGASGKIKWSSSKTSVVTVNANGKITAKKKGTAVITAKYKGKKYKCNVTVKQPVTSITLSKKTLSLTKGKTYTLKAAVKPSSANNKAVTWSSSNKKVVTVSSNGKIKAVGTGKATITVKAKDGSKKKAVCQVTVKASAMKISKSTLTLSVGESISLTVSSVGSDAIIWGSSDRNIANVSAKGVVTAKAAGTAVIAACKADGSQTAYCRVTVTENGTNTIAAGAKELLATLQGYSEQIQSDYGTNYIWTYGGRLADGTSEKSTWAKAYNDTRTKGKAVCNCSLLVRWALRDMGVINEKNFWGEIGGEFVFRGDIKEQFLKRCKIIKVYKTPNQLLTEGNLLPGDICSWVEFRHTNVYAGNGLWYDAGRGCNYVNSVFASFGPSATISMSGSKVGYIIRFIN